MLKIKIKYKDSKRIGRATRPVGNSARDGPTDPMSRRARRPHAGLSHAIKLISFYLFFSIFIIELDFKVNNNL